MHLAAATWLPRWLGGEEPACQGRRHRRHGFDPWVRKIPWRRKRQPTPVFLPGESHGQRSLVGPSPRGCMEVDRAKHKQEQQLLGWPRRSFGLVHMTQWGDPRELLGQLYRISASGLPRVGQIPCRRERLPTPVFWPGEFLGVAKSRTWLRDF